MEEDSFCNDDEYIVHASFLHIDNKDPKIAPYTGFMRVWCIVTIYP